MQDLVEDNSRLDLNNKFSMNESAHLAEQLESARSDYDAGEMLR